MSSDGTLTFVPSVHYSPTHRRRTREAIRGERPDFVAVELDERRFERLESRVRASPADLLRELPPGMAVTYGTLRAIQQTVVRLYGFDPGKTEMETAIETAAELGIDVALVDDPIAETFDALSSRVGLETIPRTMVRAQFMGPKQRLDQFELLTLPFREIESGDDVQPAIDQLRWLLPEVAEVLIDRRDRAMATRLHALRRAGHDVVVVIGAGHHNGIRRVLAELEAADAVPEVDVPIRTPTREVTRIPIE